MKMEYALIAADEIQKDLFDRRGLRQAWDDCDQEIKNEINQMIYNHIRHAIAASSGEEK